LTHSTTILCRHRGSSSIFYPSSSDILFACYCFELAVDGYDHGVNNVGWTSVGGQLHSQSTYAFICSLLILQLGLILYVVSLSILEKSSWDALAPHSDPYSTNVLQSSAEESGWKCNQDHCELIHSEVESATILVIKLSYKHLLWLIEAYSTVLTVIHCYNASNILIVQNKTLIALQITSTLSQIDCHVHTLAINGARRVRFEVSLSLLQPKL
jgi:hypothetical protein